MPTNFDPESTIDEVTDIEIYAEISYREPDSTNTDIWNADDQDIDRSVTICVCV